MRGVKKKFKFVKRLYTIDSTRSSKWKGSPSTIRIIQNRSGDELEKFVSERNQGISQGDITTKSLKGKKGFKTARVYKKLAEDDLNAGLNEANGDMSED